MSPISIGEGIEHPVHSRRSCRSPSPSSLVCSPRCRSRSLPPCSRQHRRPPPQISRRIRQPDPHPRSPQSDRASELLAHRLLIGEHVLDTLPPFCLRAVCRLLILPERAPHLPLVANLDSTGAPLEQPLVRLGAVRRVGPHRGIYVPPIQQLPHHQQILGGRAADDLAAHELPRHVHRDVVLAAKVSAHAYSSSAPRYPSSAALRQACPHTLRVSPQP